MEWDGMGWNYWVCFIVAYGVLPEREVLCAIEG